MLHSRDVENCENTAATLVGKGGIEKKGRTYCVTGEPNDVSYKNNTDIPDISIHYFPKDVALCPKWTRFDRRHRGDFTLQCRRLYASTGCEDACYEHISLVKSGEHNQWIQLRRMLIKGSVPTPNTIVQHSFRIHFTSEEWSALHCFLCHALEMYSYSLSFYMVTFALFLSYENPTNCNFYRILITEIHYL